MLPFDTKPWAKHMAATVIAITLLAAVIIHSSCITAARSTCPSSSASSCSCSPSSPRTS